LGIEVTQAIQCFDQSDGFTKCPDNSLELTDGRTTMVRVYVGHSGGYASCTQPYGPLPDGKVKVELRWAAPETGFVGWFAGSIKTVDFNVPCSKKLGVLREHETGSANFFLPPELLGKLWKEKVLWVQAGVIAPTIKESDPNNNKKEVTVSLYPRTPMRVGWALVLYYPDASTKYPVYSGPKLADEKAVGAAAGHMQSIYPVPVEYARYPLHILYGTQPGSGAKGCVKCPDVKDRANAFRRLGP